MTYDALRRRWWAALALLAVTAGAVLGLGHGEARAAGTVQVTGFGSNPSNLRMHVYAPGVVGYRPVAIELQQSAWFKADRPVFPQSTLLRLDAINETVPVYHGRARIGVDVVMANTSALLRRLAAADGHSEEIDITGTLMYQACDDTVCYPPRSVPLKWNLTTYLPDRQRTPK